MLSGSRTATAPARIVWHKWLRVQPSKTGRQPVGRTVPRDRLLLARFFPFRLNRLAVAVSQHLAQIYRGAFALEIPEWRVIATVGEDRGCTAQFVAHSTRMHKTRVSRAIAQLRRRGLIERIASDTDKRAMQLRLTRKGRSLYSQLVPLALVRERQLLACLSSAERRVLGSALERLEKRLALREKRAD
jgi:DNA-binding MarR family transcriptional regulator